jgi:peroxidase
MFAACRFLAIAAFIVTYSNFLLAEDRSINGTGNNLANPSWGSAGSDLLRIGSAAYADGLSAPSGATRPNARTISNAVVSQLSSITNSYQMSDWVFQWGQFIDHDLSLSDVGSVNMSIPIPTGDPIFDPSSTGTATMGFTRSLFDPATGTTNPRQQINTLTAYIDGSMVYGSDPTRANTLRSFSGGHLATSAGNLMPLNTTGLPNGTGGNPFTNQFYLAGDVRSNEQIGLTAVHTLFLREHNRLADAIAAANPTWTDEQIYQKARKITGAEIQAITYQEFLPALLGSSAPGLASTYNANVNAGVATEFSTAFFRVGHTMLSPNLLRIQNDGTPAPGGPVALRDTFFQMQNLSSPNQLEYILKGLATQQQQQVDIHIVDDVRNFLFGEPLPNQGFDLAALNIQRGRDHGLPDYNALRVAYGLSAVTSFDQITNDPTLAAALQSLYGDVNNIDPWVGGLAETPLGTSHVGPLITAALIDQFTRARDGDRFWFLNDDSLTATEKQMILDSSLCDIILRNTSLTNLQPAVFVSAVPEPSTYAVLGCGVLVGLYIKRRNSLRC